MMKIQSKSLGNEEYPFITITPMFTLPGVVVPIRFPSMGQIELFNHLVFAKGPGDRRSIPGRIIPKTLKKVLDTSLFNTQQYKVRINGKVGQSRERSSALSYTLVL